MKPDLNKMLEEFEMSDEFDLKGQAIPDGVINMNTSAELSPVIDILRQILKIVDVDNIIRILGFFDELDGKKDGLIHLKELARFVASVQSVPDARERFMKLIQLDIHQMEDSLTLASGPQAPASVEKVADIVRLKSRIEEMKHFLNFIQ